MRVLCRIPASRIALSKSQFDAVLVGVAQGLHGTVELIAEDVEARDEHIEAAESDSCAVVSAVVAAQMQASPAVIQTAVTTADTGFYIEVMCH